LVKSRLAHRTILPKDLWSLKGIIGSGIDSSVYKDKIEELWGRRPLDVYSCTEGGVIATQAWDYQGMTFVPSLNFLEFIPEDELIKWQMDRSYKMKTLLLSEVEPGNNYEIVITNFHGGSLVRYRIGDMIKITSLSNDKLGIGIPQMVFERRVDDVIDLAFIKLSEKTIWQIIEKSGVSYNDWVAFRNIGEIGLRILIEPSDGVKISESDLSQFIFNELTKLDDVKAVNPSDSSDMVDFKVSVLYLPKGSFSNYMRQRQNEGADPAHIKPPHINPSPKILSALLGEAEETIVVTKTVKAHQHIQDAVITDKGK
jgi:hypothetical protein